MSLDRLKKLNTGVQFNREPEMTPVFAEKPNSKELQLRAQIILLETQLSNLRYDIISILDAIEGNNKELTFEEARNAYTLFRADPLHVMNRITDKTNKDITIRNDEGKE